MSGVSNGTGRRTLVGGAALALTGALSAVGITAGAAASVADLAINPDADMIALSRLHVANLQAYNNSCAEDEASPLHAAYLASYNRLQTMRPETMEGWIAKAHSAKAEARQPDGQEDPDGTVAAAWAWELLNDAIRIARRA